MRTLIAIAFFLVFAAITMFFTSCSTNRCGHRSQPGSLEPMLMEAPADTSLSTKKTNR